MCRLAQTLGSARTAMQCPSKVSACRRELNSHEAAEPREDSHPLKRTWRQVPVESKRAGRQSIMPSGRPARGLLRVGAAQSCKDEEPLCHIERAHCVGSTGVQPVRRAAAISVGASALSQVPRRLEYVARHGRPRGAGSTWSGSPGVTGPGQAHHRRAQGAALPNPSLKRSTNGRPPSPGRWYAVHFHRPGLGVLPLAPA